MKTQLATPAAAARAHEEIFSYWSSLRRDGKLPGRADIHPAAFRKLLPTISLIDVEREPLNYRLRLAGTGLYPVYGREITGRGLREVYSREAADYWRAELDRIVRLRRPGVGCHSLAWKGQPHVSMLWMRLPLASDGERVDMILGYDAVVGMAVEMSSGIRAA
ncbi:MAG TPA: PAS domain-containing protein [Caulobacteraceae bacterium]